MRLSPNHAETAKAYEGGMKRSVKCCVCGGKVVVNYIGARDKLRIEFLWYQGKDWLDCSHSSCTCLQIFRSGDISLRDLVDPLSDVCLFLLGLAKVLTSILGRPDDEIAERCLQFSEARCCRHFPGEQQG